MKTLRHDALRNQPTAARGRRRFLCREVFAVGCAFLFAGSVLPRAAEAVTITFNSTTSSDLTLNTNYSSNALPDSTTDLRLTSTSKALTLNGTPSGTTLRAQSLDISTGSVATDYFIRNSTTDASNSTLILGNPAGQANGFVVGANTAGAGDLIYLATGTGALSLTIQGANGSTGTGVLGLTLANSGNFDTTASTTLNISAAISGAYTISKIGAGTLSLSGNNTFTGFTTTNGVTLLGANGALGGILTMTVGTASTSAAATVRLSTTALDAGASLTNVIADTAAVTINGNSGVGGTLNLAGGIETIGSLSGTGALGKLVIGDYTNASNVVIPGGLTVGDSTSTTFVGVISGTHTGAGAALTKQGSGTLTLSGANTFTGGVAINGGALALGSNDTATPSGPLGASGTISFGGGTLQYLTGNTTDYSARFSNAINQLYSINTNNLAVTLASALTSQGGSLTKLGAGTLTLSGANTFTGGVTLSGGLLALNVAETGSSGPLGVGGNINFNGGTLQYSANNAVDYSARFTVAASSAYSVDTNSQNVAFASALGGSGGLNKIGAGTLTLSGANTYTGATTLTAGTLLLNSGETGGAGPLGVGGTIVFAGGNLLYSANNAVDYSARFSTDPGQAYRINTATQTVVLASNLTSSTGTLNKFGTGTLTLSGANTYTGTTTLSAGILLLNSGETGTAGPLGVGGNINFNGGTLQYSANNAVDYSARITAGANQTYFINTGGQAVTFASALTTSTAALTKQGGGTLTLSGANTYTGTTTISAGILRVDGAETSNAGPLGVGGAINFNGGTLQYTSNNSVDYSARFTTGTNQSYIVNTGGQTVTFGSALTSANAALFKQGTGTLALSGANTYTGATNLGAGNLRLLVAEMAGTSGPLGVGGAINFNGGTLQYSVSNNYDYSPRFSAANGQTYNINTATANVSFATDLTSVGGALNKFGTGILTLTGNNTYSGGTTVSAGVLQLSNAVGTSATGSGAVTVNGGATLQGLGSIDAGGNLITINGTLAPGTPGTTGTIRLASTAANGALTLASTSTLAFDITDVNTKDLVTLNNNTLALNGGILALTLPASGFDYTGTYALFTGVSGLTTAANGAFTTVTGYDMANYAATFTLNGTEYDLTFGVLTNVPEPSTLVSGALLLACVAVWHARRTARRPFSR